jgi:uncharacterized RmlC-like cupin family protein
MRKLLLMLTAMGLLLVPAGAEPTIIGERDGKDVVTVRAGEATQSKQDLPNFVGISGATAGAKHLSLLKVVIPPGGSAAAHVHKGYESAIYLIQGRVETRYGEGLKKSVVNVAGDFIFIPADVPHQLQSQRHRASHRHRDAQRSGRAGARGGLSKGRNAIVPGDIRDTMSPHSPSRLPK